jgi:two-component system LytT family response regulator
MNKITTIIVDDEPPARRLIRTYLEREPDIEIVAECANGAEAIAALEEREPDLLFLDIQMPEISGFDVLMAADLDELPAVIFVTAYEEYALRAFEVHAVDYLLKPVDEERFIEALERARRLVGSRDADDIRRLAGLLDDVRARRPVADRLLVKSAGYITFLTTDEIDWIEAAGNYMRVHSGRDVHLMRETMANLETMLDAARFVRVHRSAIVNLDRIKELRPSLKGEFEILLRSGERLILSRKYRKVLEERLGRPL